ncbi:hypothetical protein [Selenomonas sp. ND2010]|uniref:hypothetical protein n=1 Tax=Selenomonas sp. ND2010 TaxID=1410618 RepID=UPI00051C5CD6|nr:hypothetical protein [Selenomonas sp. ND2010]
MKKHILALCLACLVAMSANAFAATPEAETLSVEQQGAQKWMETMLVKADYKTALSQLGEEGKKALTEKQMKEKQEAILKNLGKMQKHQFNAWIRLGKYDRIVYAAQFEKYPLVQCDIIVDQKGQVIAFGLSPIQQQKQDAGAEKDKKKTKK